jgi:threonine dehydratase
MPLAVSVTPRRAGSGSPTRAGSPISLRRLIAAQSVLPARRGPRYKSRMTQPASALPVNSADIDAAARVLAPFAVRTPLLSPPVLCERIGARVFLKPEMLQRTGSFKFRGAFNKLSSIPRDARGGGVVAFSSGNHAQGVAAAAQILNMRATIVMPSDAPLSKRERTKSYGAEVVLYDRDREDREAIARDIAGKRGATLVPPYDDPLVIAGQGTVGREIAEDMAALGMTPDIVVAPASGGGLVAGVATAIKARYPQAMLMSAEPEGFDDHARSLRAGKREPHRAEGRTICDALMASIPGEITFAINSRLLSQGLTATDAEVGIAVGFAFRELKLVVEPGGAVGLAALLAGRIDIGGKNVVIVLSGGNVDADLYAKLIG